MSFVVKVILFPQYTLVFIRTAIADIWRFAKLVTELLLVILAQLVAKTACGATFRAVRLVLAKITSLAIFAFYASVVDAVWCKFVTGCSAGTNLPRNS
jgi:hypothetical protein